MQITAMEYPAPLRAGRTCREYVVAFPAASQKRGIPVWLTAENPAEAAALREAYDALKRVLPEHAVRLDALPLRRSDGHGGFDSCDGIITSLHIFTVEQE